MRAYIPQGLRLMIRYHRLRQDSAKKSKVRVQKLIYCNRKWTQFNTPSRWYNAKIYTSTIAAIWARLLISIMEKFGFEGAVCSAATNTKKRKKTLVPIKNCEIAIDLAMMSRRSLANTSNFSHYSWYCFFLSPGG